MNSYQSFIGIDPAKDDFAAALFTSAGEPVHSCEGFGNNVSGFETLEQWFQKHEVQKSDALICVETTGVYSEAICYHFHQKGYTVCLEAPQKVKRAFKLKGHKTDPVDAAQTAEYAYRFSDKLTVWQPRSEVIEKLSVWLTLREQLVVQKTAASNALKAVQQKVIQLPEAIEVYESNIQAFEEQIQTIENNMKRLIQTNPHFQKTLQLLVSIPGIGQLTAINLLVATNGGSQDVEYTKLAAYIGICPYKHESGKSIRKKAKSSGMGPSRLRKLLFLAARSLIAKNDVFKKYYLRKIGQGKHHMIVMNNIENKLLRIVCAVIKQQKPYDPNYVSINPNLL